VNQNSRPNRDLSRRQLLRYSGIGVAAAAGSSFLVACGGDDDSGGGGGGGGQQSSGGTLIHGATGGGSKDTLDPHAPVTKRVLATELVVRGSTAPHGAKSRATATTRAQAARSRSMR